MFHRLLSNNFIVIAIELLMKPPSHRVRGYCSSENNKGVTNVVEANYLCRAYFGDPAHHQ